MIQLLRKPKQLVVAGLLLVGLSGVFVAGQAMLMPATASAASKHYCGQSKEQVETSIDIGCRGQGNPITDMMFAIIRLLSDGVGLVIVGSIILGGIQYTMSAGDPQAASKAVNRIRSTVFALILFLFAYPLLNYLLPSGFFK